MDSPFSFTTASTSTLAVDNPNLPKVDDNIDPSQATRNNPLNLAIDLPAVTARYRPSIQIQTSTTTTPMSGKGFVEPHHSHLPRRRVTISGLVPATSAPARLAHQPRYGFADSDSSGSDEGGAGGAWRNHRDEDAAPQDQPQKKLDEIEEVPSTFDSNKTESGFLEPLVEVEIPQNPDVGVVVEKRKPSFALQRMIIEQGGSIPAANVPPSPSSSHNHRPTPIPISASFPSNLTHGASTTQPTNNLPRRALNRTDERARSLHRRGVSLPRRPREFSADSAARLERQHRPKPLGRGVSVEPSAYPHPRLDARRTRRTKVAGCGGTGETMKLQEMRSGTMGVWLGVDVELEEWEERRQRRSYYNSEDREEGWKEVEKAMRSLGGLGTVQRRRRKKVVGVVRVVSPPDTNAESDSEDDSESDAYYNPAISSAPHPSTGLSKYSESKSNGRTRGKEGKEGEGIEGGVRVYTIRISSSTPAPAEEERGTTRLTVDQMKQGCMFLRGIRSTCLQNEDRMDAGSSHESTRGEEEQEEDPVVLILASSEDGMVDALSMALCYMVVDELTGAPSPERQEEKRGVVDDEAAVLNPKEPVDADAITVEKQREEPRPEVPVLHLSLPTPPPNLEGALTPRPTSAEDATTPRPSDTGFGQNLGARPDEEMLKTPQQVDHGASATDATPLETQVQGVVQIVVSHSDEGTPEGISQTDAQPAGTTDSGENDDEKEDYTPVHHLLWKLYDAYHAIPDPCQLAQNPPANADVDVEVDIEGDADVDVDRDEHHKVDDAPSRPSSEHQSDCNAVPRCPSRPLDGNARRFEASTLVTPKMGERWVVSLREEWRGLVGFEGGWKIWEGVAEIRKGLVV